MPPTQLTPVGAILANRSKAPAAKTPVAVPAKPAAKPAVSAKAVPEPVPAAHAAAAQAAAQSSGVHARPELYARDS